MNQIIFQNIFKNQIMNQIIFQNIFKNQIILLWNLFMRRLILFLFMYKKDEILWKKVDLCLF